MSEETNVCVICLYPLSANVVGTCVPCGHCFHVDCFNPWIKRQSNKKTKCPTCNTTSKDFCRLFLDFSVIEADVDDDSLSLSSAEDETIEAITDSRESIKKSSLSKHAGDGIAVIDLSSDNTNQIIDLSSDDQYKENSNRVVEQSKRKSTGGRNHSSSADDNTYKKMAKTLKRRNSMIADALQNKIQENENLSKQCKRLREEVEETKEILQSEVEKQEDRVRQIDSLKLENVRLRRGIDDANEKVRKEKETAKIEKENSKELGIKLKQLQDIHRHEVERARAHSMKEVQQILEQYPKLTNEVKKLTNENNHLKEKIKENEKKTCSANNNFAVNLASNKNNLKYSTTSVKQAKKILSTVSIKIENESKAASQVLNNLANTKSMEGVTKMTLKLSAHAARFSRPSNQSVPRREPQGIDVLDAVNKRQNAELQKKGFVNIPSIRNQNSVDKVEVRRSSFNPNNGQQDIRNAFKGQR